MITWYDIGLHRKATVFIDIDGFWGPVLAVFDHLDRQKMLRAHVRGGYDRIDGVADMPAAAARYSGRAAASRIE
jgi:predicted Rossmann-fold nucleotide-binding protein